MFPIALWVVVMGISSTRRNEWATSCWLLFWGVVVVIEEEEVVICWEVKALR